MKPTFAAAAALLLLGAPALAQNPTLPETRGRIDRFAIDAHGRVDGVLLSDGTELITAPVNGPALMASVRPGDSIALATGPMNTLRISDARLGQLFSMGGIDSVARGGGPASVAVPYAPVDNATSLRPLGVTGRVAMLTHTLNGDPSGFVMDDGTQVHVVSGVAASLADLHAGEVVRVDGRGTATPQGTGMWALSITKPSGFVVLDMNRGSVGVPELGLTGR